MTRSHRPAPNRMGRTAWRFRVLTALFAAALAAATAPAAPASAHSSLISSSPAADSVLPQPPEHVELVFNESIRDFQPKIAITVGEHDPVEITPTVDGTKVSADLAGAGLPAAADGTPVAWKIGYRVVSADGHPVSGASCPSPSATDLPPACPNPRP